MTPILKCAKEKFKIYSGPKLKKINLILIVKTHKKQNGIKMTKENTTLKPHKMATIQMALQT